MKSAALRVDLFCGAGRPTYGSSAIVDQATGEVLALEPLSIHDLLVDTATGEVRSVWRQPDQRPACTLVNSPACPSLEGWQIFAKIIGLSDGR